MILNICLLHAKLKTIKLKEIVQNKTVNRTGLNKCLTSIVELKTGTKHKIDTELACKITSNHTEKI